MTSNQSPAATLDGAILLATRAHHGQRDRYDRPFILHPLRVMARMATDDEKIVAVLHDVLEKTPETAAHLRQLGFSEAVVAAIEALSRRDGEDYDAFVNRTKANPLAARVKLGDLEDNMDVRRMPEVSADDAKRLARYRRAYALLQAGG